MGISRHVAAENLAPVVADHKETKQHTKSERGYREEIHCAMASRWFRRNVSQRLARSGFLGTRRSHRETVVSDTLKPSFKSSPWTRGAPQVGFSAAMRKISARISLLTRFWPPICLALESHFQYSRKPARCQPTTVLGVTTMRGPFHPAQSFRNPTQNSLCNAVSRRRGRLACRATSCWRRARFSRRRSSCELRALKIQPRRCRSGAIMAGILPKTANRVCRQISDSATTPCVLTNNTVRGHHLPGLDVG